MEGALPSGAVPVVPVAPETAGDEAFPRRRWTAPGLRLARVTRGETGGKREVSRTVRRRRCPPSQP